ncbi:MAG TPA: YceI family protein [Fimbriimonadaceae bacterium]|nr:YceI family protein [Fimbriimonadaceae bacterium]
MKRILFWTPFTIMALVLALMALHPGEAMAKPRMAALTPTPFPESATYVIDEMHTGVYFDIRHLGLSNTTGCFKKFKGTVIEDPKDLTKSSVEFAAEIDSIDTAVPARDAHLKTADFFDAAKYPTVRFISTSVEKRGEGYVVHGDLTIKDKAKRISIPFKHYGPLTLTVGDNSTRIGVIAEPIVIKRSDFGVGGDFKLPGGVEGASDNVTVRISFEGILKK